MHNLNTRLARLEAGKRGASPVWLRVVSNSADAEALMVQREDEARAEYVAEYGEPVGGFRLVERCIIVTGVPRAQDFRGGA